MSGFSTRCRTGGFTPFLIFCPAVSTRQSATAATITAASAGSARATALAMSMAVAGLLASGETTVHGAADASVSYPDFWQDLDLLLQDTR